MTGFYAHVPPAAGSIGYDRDRLALVSQVRAPHWSTLGMLRRHLSHIRWPNASRQVSPADNYPPGTGAPALGARGR
jgi:hypothetical protein